MARQIKPLKKFRVYIDRVYYLVYVWRTLKELRDHRVSIGLPRTRCQACTVVYEHHYNRQIGEIHFVDYWFNGEGSSYYVLSHEATHAAVGMLALAGRDFSTLNKKATSVRSDSVEELLAEIASLITHKIAVRLKLE